jgi:hypothetical protein
MSNISDAASRDAAQGERMIKVKLRFWTNDIAEEGKVVAKHAWSAGVIRMERNNTHGIHPWSTKTVSLAAGHRCSDRKTLLEHGVLLHPSRRMRKYVMTSPAKASKKP